MPYCYSLNGETQATRVSSFPDPELNQMVRNLQSDPQAKFLTIPCPTAGIVPAIVKAMETVNAKEYFCCFSNKVGNTSPLTVIYKA